MTLTDHDREVFLPLLLTRDIERCHRTYHRYRRRRDYSGAAVYRDAAIAAWGCHERLTGHKPTPIGGIDWINGCDDHTCTMNVTVPFIAYPQEDT